MTKTKKTTNPKNKPTDNRREFFSDSFLRAVEGEGNERKFLLSFSSEEPYKRWFGQEILSHSEGAVDLQRLNDIGCVLFNHDRDKVVAKVNEAYLKDYRCYAEIEFDDDEFSEKIYQKVKSGTLKGVSVGYQVGKWEEISAGSKSEDGRFEGPCSVAIEWTPYEISIVSVPADPTVGVGRSHEEAIENNQNEIAVYEKQIQINKNFMF